MSKKKSKKSSSPIWHGRFSNGPADSTQEFVESLSFDKRLYKYDIAGSIVHAKMLAYVGLITQKELRAIIKGLKEIAKEIDEGKFAFDTSFEDIHMAIETTLIEKIGEPGRKLHTARSRNDQIALDIRLYLRDIIDTELFPAIRNLQSAFVELADKNRDVICPGYTHLQHAQPIFVAHLLLSYVEQLERDNQRLADAYKRINVLPLGSCALAGTTLEIERSFVAKELGFSDISRNSIDSVSDRDFAIEFVFVLAMIASHLSRWAEDWILWASSEFDFIELDERYCTGSSIMPQKRNPDILELIRGKTGRVYGDVMNLLTLVKGLPSSYNRDLQEDKPAIFDAIDTIVPALKISAEIVSSAKFKADKMLAQTSEGFLEATGLAEYLVGKGIPFRQAHRTVGKLVAYCEKNNKKLFELTLDEFRQFGDNIQFDADVYDMLRADKLVSKYISYGSAGKKSVSFQLKYWKSKLAKS